MSKEIIIINVMAKNEEQSRMIFDYTNHYNSTQDDFYILVVPFKVESILRAKELSELDTDKMLKCVDDIKTLLEEKVKDNRLQEVKKEFRKNGKLSEETITEGLKDNGTK